MTRLSCGYDLRLDPDAATRTRTARALRSAPGLSCGYDLRPSLTGPGHCTGRASDPRLAFHSPTPPGVVGPGDGSGAAPACVTGPIANAGAPYPTPDVPVEQYRRREPCTRDVRTIQMR